MSIQDQIGELGERLQDLVEQAKTYFGQLNDQERYGWIGEGAGVALLLAGFALLIM